MSRRHQHAHHGGQEQTGTQHGPLGTHVALFHAEDPIRQGVLRRHGAVHRKSILQADPAGIVPPIKPPKFHGKIKYITTLTHRPPKNTVG